MRKKTLIVALVILISIFCAIPCAAADNITKINDLIENSIALDSTEVTVQGEVIGEALERGEYAWINISDTTNAIGIWVKQSDISQITFYGDYKHQGDTVRITGTFYRACPEHGGDVDIHCRAIQIVESGHTIKELVSPYKIIVTVALVLITLLIIVIYFKSNKKLQKIKDWIWILR